MSKEEYMSCEEFIVLYLNASPDVREAIEEFLNACKEGITTEEAIMRVTNESIRADMLREMTRNGVEMHQPALQQAEV